MDKERINTIALQELKEENFRKAIEKRKEELKRSWWERFRQWRIIVKLERRK